MKLGINQQAYWDSVAEQKEFTTFLDLDLVKPFINIDSFIVDYGCGYGRTLNQLWQKGYKNTLGFDFSAEMIYRGRKEFPFLNLRTSNNNFIDRDDKSVDMIILFAVLTCIIKDEDQVSLMHEIERVLKPGGVIFINDFLVNTDDRNSKRYAAFLNKYQKHGVFELPEGAVLRHHETGWIDTLTKDFKKEVMNKITFKTMNGNLSNGFVFVGRKG